MNYSQLIAGLNINPKNLTDKKVQTRYKIKYILEYVKLWLCVLLNVEDKNCVNFFDVMCNAGIYLDGELTTSMEVLLLFCEKAKVYPNKHFHIFMNDFDPKSIEICKKIAEYLYNDNGRPENVHLHFDTIDVNEYLERYDLFDRFLTYNAISVFFIDPYDLRTVKLSKIAQLVKKYYCEVIFNVITSDYVRNKNDNRINDCLGKAEIDSKDDLMKHIAEVLKVGHIKHSFAYQFNNIKNCEIYQIFFATPHPEGLRKLKDALWNTFDGSEFFKTQNQAFGQMSLLSNTVMQETNIDYYAREARELLVKEFSNLTVECKDIETFLLERTMLKSTGYINKVLKPLIDDGIVLKLGNVSRSNYRQDSYKFSKVAM